MFDLVVVVGYFKHPLDKINKEKMMKKSSLFCLAVLVCMFTCMPLTAYAIDNSPAWSLTEFDFSNAGARARGFGGAFVGLADDATAAVTNPAGLAQLPKKQFAIELSAISSDSEDIPWSSEEDGTVHKDSINSISFLSLSLPITDNLFGAIYYNKLADQESKMYLPSDEDNGIPFFNAKNNLSLHEYGISAATGFGTDKFKIGVGISMIHMDLSAQSISDININGIESNPEVFSTSGGDSGIAYKIGGLWSPDNRLKIGINANIYPTLDLPTQITSRVLSATDTAIRYLALTELGMLPNFRDSLSLDDELDIPDVFAAGLSYQFSDHWTFSFEARYTLYSQTKVNGIPPSAYRTGEAVTGSGTAAFWNPDEISPWGQIYAESTPDEYEFEDAWSWHFGGEYLTLIKDTPVAFRLGGYLEEAHGLKFNGDETDYSNTVDVYSTLPYAFSGYPTAFAEILDGGDDIWHFTPGIGTVIANKLQIDLAADFSKEQNEYLISFVYQF